MKAVAAIVIVLAGFLAGTGCDGEELRDVTRIDDLRVLAVRAEPPEVPPGAGVVLDALVVDPLGGTWTHRWYACVMADEQGGFFGGSSETATSGGDGAGISTDPFDGSCAARVAAGERYTWDLGSEPTAMLEVPADLFDGDEALRIAYGLSEDLEIPADAKLAFLGVAGVNIIVELVVDGSRGKRIVSTKRVNVSTESPVADNARNTNPVDLTMHIGLVADEANAPKEAPLPVAGHCLSQGPAPLTEGTGFLLMPVNVPEPRPSYVVLLAGTIGGEAFQVQTLEETYFYSIFATAGRIGEETAKVPGEPGSTLEFGRNDVGPATLWVVLRDGRGGVTWCREDLVIAER
jgi:hypothetical protein